MASFLENSLGRGMITLSWDVLVMRGIRGIPTGMWDVEFEEVMCGM